MSLLAGGGEEMSCDLRVRFNDAATTVDSDGNSALLRVRRLGGEEAIGEASAWSGYLSAGSTLARRNSFASSHGYPSWSGAGTRVGPTRHAGDRGGIPMLGREGIEKGQGTICGCYCVWDRAAAVRLPERSGTRMR